MSDASDVRIERAEKAFAKWEDAFDPPLTHLQRCMAMNAVFEMQRMERDRCIEIVSKANWRRNNEEIIKRMES